MKYTAIYVRRSVSDSTKGNNSLSISSQKEDCIRYLQGDENYKVYCDDGKSAKDIKHRPEFLQMMQDARDGLISQIIVKKYDRFSRNMREYLNVSEELDNCGVPVISLCEPFNTATKEGRLMRNNLLNFAEFERKAIADRVKDAYDTKAMETGFYQGGVVYFGFENTRQTINGKTGSVLVPADTARTIHAMFEVYAKPDTSLRDVCMYIRENDLPITSYIKGKAVERKFDACNIAAMLKNPLYVRADKNVYEYLFRHNYRIIDDIDDFDGIHGLFWHNYRSKTDRYVKLGYHEGIVEPDLWLAVQEKISTHQLPKKKGSVTRSFLVGTIRCPHCGRALKVDYSYNKNSGNSWRYLSCTGNNSVAGCVQFILKTKISDVEELVYTVMKEHIEQFEISGSKTESRSDEAEKIKTDIIRIDTEVAKLMDKLADADPVLFEYIQNRINTLHNEKTALEQKLFTVERKVKKVDTKPLLEPFKHWEQLSIEEQNKIARLILDKVYVSDTEGIDIHFAF